jgi:hypothetical protein
MVLVAAILQPMPAETSARGADWELYREHREHFTDAVLALAPPAGGTLCVLGAGKCNDLDLERLCLTYREVHLVDLDPGSVASAISRENEATRARLFPLTPVDLSVLTPKRAAKWQRKPPSSSELSTSSDLTLQGILTRLRGPFDTVVSACVLTQLGFALTRALGETHPALGALRAAIVETHLRTLLDLTRPNGRALFVCDLASSTHYPLAELPPDAELADVMRDVIEKRAFYHVAQPSLIRRLLAELTPEGAVVDLPPWLWNGPQSRTYLVYGMVATR